jgi:magnesium transporter
MPTSPLKMNKYIKSRSSKAGLGPGTLIHVGEHIRDNVKIELIDYNSNNYETRSLESIKEGLTFKGTGNVSWIDVEGVHDPSVVECIGEYFGSHQLILEDMLNTDQRPKIEVHNDFIFIVLKMLSYNEKTSEIDIEQVSIIFGSHFLISLQEGKEGDVFDPVRERIKKGTRIREKGTDYLAYCLLDVIIDNYFIILEKIGDKMEDLDNKLLHNPNSQVLQEIYSLKREIIFLRKTIWPMRELIGKFEREDSELIYDSTRKYLRDAYEHIIQIIDNEETFRDMISGMMDLYLSVLSNKMNEIMKVLSIIGTIFIPLTFIAGVYGMNFDYMPELRSHYGYFGVWIVMIVIAVIMLAFFKKNKWI